MVQCCSNMDLSAIALGLRLPSLHIGLPFTAVTHIALFVSYSPIHCFRTSNEGFVTSLSGGWREKHPPKKSLPRMPELMQDFFFQKRIGKKTLFWQKSFRLWRALKYNDNLTLCSEIYLQSN